MGYTIAIAGKGGTGKTSISALIIRLLKERKAGSILGIDADPNNNLVEVFGYKAKETIGHILDQVASAPDKIPAGMSKDRFIEYQVQTIIKECDGFDILTMGKPEGPGCYCYVNNVLRNAMANLVKDYDYTVIDNEAGLEHLSRKTTGSADALLVISDSSAAGLRAARRINDLVAELKIRTRKKLLLVNRSDKEIEKEKISSTGLEYLGRIPEDHFLLDLSVKNKTVFNLKRNAPSLTAMDKFLDRIVSL